MPHADVTITKYVTIYFNDKTRRPSYGPNVKKNVLLSTLLASGEDLHEKMKADETIAGYQTYEKRAAKIDGVLYTSNQIAMSPTICFGSLKAPHKEKATRDVLVGGGGHNFTTRMKLTVYDRKTDKQLWPVFTE